MHVKLYNVIVKYTKMKILKDYSLQIIYTPDYDFVKLDTLNFNKKTILILTTGWYKSLKLVNLTKSIVENNKYDFSEIILLTNSESEKEFYSEATLNFENKKTNISVLFCSAGIFQNENIFVIKPNYEKKHDLVINSKFLELKRVSLAKLCKSVLHIGYFTNNQEKIIIPDFGIIANFENNVVDLQNIKFLTKTEIVNKLNESKIGGIFSKIEGHCRSSGEYLMCGLPVISTVCFGGREFFYNEKNSIICEDNEENILNCLNDALNKLKSGYFNSQEIRKNYLEQIETHRFRLLNKIQEIFINDGKKINIDELRLKLFFPF